LDPATGKQISLSNAFKCDVMDPKHGSVVNSHTRETISLKDVVMASKIMRNREGMTMEEAINNKCYDIKRNIVFHPVTKEEMSLEEAIDSGVISSRSTIIDPSNGDKITIEEAIQKDILDLDTGKVINVDTGLFTPLSSSVNERALDLQDAITKGLYDQDRNTVIDPVSNIEITFSEAVEKGVIKPNSEMLDPGTGRKITLDDAISSGLMDVSTGLLLNSQTGESIGISEHLSAKPLRVRVDTAPMLTLDQAMRDGLYNEDGYIINPLSREVMKVDEAIERGVLDPMSKVKDPNSGETITLEDAIEAGIVDTNIGIVINTHTGQSCSLMEAHSRGLIPVTEQVKAVSVTQMFNSMVDGKTGLLKDPVTGKNIKFQDAVSSAMVTTQNLRITDKKTGELLSYENAVKRKLIDPETGNVWDPNRKRQVPMETAIKEGLVIEFAKPPMSPREALLQGLVESKTG